MNGALRHCAGPRCRETVTDITLCADCVTALRIELGDVPDLLRHLDITRSRQDQLTPPWGNGPGSGENPLPYKPHISEVAWILHNTLGTWAASLAGNDTTTEKLSTADLARWLLRRTSTIRVALDAGQLVEEVTHAIHHARHAIDRPDDQRQYLGPCGAATTTGSCPEEIYGVPWATTTTCPACGTRHDTAGRQQWLLDVVQDHLGTAVEIAGFLQSHGVKCTYDAIQGYVRRQRLAPVPDTKPPLYRIRDVLAAIQDRYQHRNKTAS